MKTSESPPHPTLCLPLVASLMVIVACRAVRPAMGQTDAVADLRSVCVLPTQAYLCDLAGVGEVLESRTNGFRVAVSSYWIGNPGSNILDIATTSLAPPATNTPIVFLGTTNTYFSFDIVEPLSLLCQWSFLTNRTVNPLATESGVAVEITPTHLRLLADGLSWFDAASDNGMVLAYASNLVYQARVAHDPHAFYSVVRDGSNVSPELSHRVHVDSVYQLMHWGSYETEEYVRSIWDDPLVAGRARGMLRWAILNRFEWVDP